MDPICEDVQQTHQAKLPHESTEKNENHGTLYRLEIKEARPQLNTQKNQKIDKSKESRHSGSKKIHEHTQNKSKNATSQPSGLD